MDNSKKQKGASTDQKQRRPRKNSQRVDLLEEIQEDKVEDSQQIEDLKENLIQNQNPQMKNRQNKRAKGQSEMKQGKEQILPQQENKMADPQSKKRRRQKKNDDSDDLSDYGSEGTQVYEQREDVVLKRKKQRKKQKIIGIAIAVVLVLLAVGLTLYFVLRKNDSSPSMEDINPYFATETLKGSSTIRGSLSTISSFKAQNVDSEQTQLSSKLLALFTSVITMAQSKFLALKEQYLDYSVDWTQIKQTQNNRFIENLVYSFDMVDFSIARFTLTDKNTPRFSITDSVLNKSASNPQMRLNTVGFQFTANPFGFSFSDPSDSSKNYISTDGQKLAFMDKYIQMDFKLPSQRIYGLGERVREFNLKTGTWTMWSNGYSNKLIDDGTGRKGTYGVHPFILFQSSSSENDYFGIFFRNSNAQTPVIRFNDDGTSTLSYITIGGQIEAHFFLHGTAKQVISLYHNFIGKPKLPAFWSLGWQQASEIYNSFDDLNEMIQGYKTTSLPLDVVYLSRFYQYQNQDFSMSADQSKDLQAFQKTLSDSGIKLMAQVKSTIYADTKKNSYYTQGAILGLFLRSSIFKSDEFSSILVAMINQKLEALVDWLHPKAESFLVTGLQGLVNMGLKFDGLWIDGKDTLTDTNGEIDPNQNTQSDKDKISSEKQGSSNQNAKLKRLQASSSWYFSDTEQTSGPFDTYHLPFIARDAETKDSNNWDEKTISLNATHPGFSFAREYDLHSLNGLLLSKTISSCFNTLKPDTRPFILSRSTFSSSGKYTSHIFDETDRDWPYLRYSISSIMNMNMFGIPHTGSSICGYYGQERNDELCLRWIQLAAFFPLARFNQFNDPSQLNQGNEPYKLKSPFLNQAKEAMQKRYAYLGMIYTCLFEASKNGGTCFDPLFYHYPNDKYAYSDYESSFIVANSLKVSPILAKLGQGVTTYSAYFPSGIWVNLEDPSEIIDATPLGTTAQLKIRNSLSPFLKPGSMVVLYSLDGFSYQIDKLSSQPVRLIINRDEFGYAEGTFFSDTKNTLSSLEEKDYSYYGLRFTANTLQINFKDGNKDNFSQTQGQQIVSIEILNAEDLKTNLCVCGVSNDHQVILLFTATYDEQTKVLNIQTLNGDALQIGQIQQISIGESYQIIQSICGVAYLADESWSGPLVQFTGNSVSLTMDNLFDKSQAKMSVSVFDQDILNLRLSPINYPNYNIYHNEVPSEILNPVPGPATLDLKDYQIQLNTNDPTKSQLPLTFTSKITNQRYLTVNFMYFADYISAVTLNIQSPGMKVFGLGQRNGKNFYLQNGVYTMNGVDRQPTLDDGIPTPSSVYGSHPFIAYKNGPNSYIGLFLLNNNPQDWYVNLQDGGTDVVIEIISTGGIGNFYIIPDMKDLDSVIERYHRIIGNPVTIPQWALGWHLSRRGFNNTQELYDIVSNYRKYQIPLESVWVDRDYTDSYKPFTLNTNEFAGLPQFVAYLHSNNQKFAAVVDFPISPQEGNPAYDEGVKQNVFMQKDLTSKELFQGQSWQGKVVYPDFMQWNTQNIWWPNQLNSLNTLFEVDALTLDLNEISNFCDGLCAQDRDTSKLSTAQKLPYSPSGKDIELHSLSLDAVNKGDLVFTLLDSRAFSSILQQRATQSWTYAKPFTKRKLILSRATYPGSGTSSSTWIGDNFASQDWLIDSVLSTMMMGVFGMPLSGGDICGFNGEPDPELCARWYTIGAFFPFSRINKNAGFESSDPWKFQQQYQAGGQYMDVMINAIYQKLSLVRYYYSYLFLNSLGLEANYRKPFFRHVSFAYETDTVTAFQNDLLLGDSLKLSINNVDSSTTTQFDFPPGTWCDIVNPKTKCLSFTTYSQVSLPSSVGQYGLHLRQGCILPYQDAKSLNVQTTVDLQSYPVDFHILGSKTSSIDNSWQAQASYANDNGISLKIDGQWNKYNIKAIGTFSDTADESIVITFEQVVQSATYQKKDPTCNAINKNDYLGKLYIYNADTFIKSQVFQVVGTKVDKSTANLGTAAFDNATKRIIFTADSGVVICLSSFPTITFSPKPSH